LSPRGEKKSAKKALKRKAEGGTRAGGRRGQKTKSSIKALAGPKNGKDVGGSVKKKRNQEKKRFVPVYGKRPVKTQKGGIPVKKGFVSVG